MIGAAPLACSADLPAVHAGPRMLAEPRPSGRAPLQSAAWGHGRRRLLGRTAAATWLLVIGFAGEAQAEDVRPRATMAAERALAPGGEGSRTGSLEDQAVCGFWTERLLAALYHLAAGRPDAARVRGIPGLERVTFSTSDGRRLGGDKLRAYADERRRPRGDVLVALGNAMLAEQVVGAFRFLQADGVDVHVHDHRG